MKGSSFQILSDITKIINSTLDLNKCLDRIVEVTAENLETASCSILLLDENQSHLILKASKGLSQESVDRVQLKVGQGIVGWVAQERETVALRDASQDPRFLYVPETKEEQFTSMLAAPIMYFGRCIGVLYVQTERERDFQEEEIRLLYSEELRDRGYEVETAESADQVEEKLKGFNPDIITLDIKMPGIDGIEYLRKLREDNIQTPLFSVPPIPIINKTLEVGPRTPMW